MNLPRDREHDLERLLADDAGEFGALYRRLSRVDPPRRLDRAILGEAARAARGRLPRQPRWVVAVGSAAGIVLAAGIAWQVGRQLDRQDMPESRGTAPQVVPVKPISESESRRQKQAPAAQDAATEALAVPALEPAAAPPPVAKPLRRREPAPATTAKPASVPPLPARSAEAEPTPFVPEAPAAAANTAAKGRVVGVPGQGASDRAQERSRQDSMSSGAAPPASGSVELRRDMQLSPDTWLGHIRQLLEQGRRQQATESLRLFRRAYPDRQIPEDLRELLH